MSRNTFARSIRSSPLLQRLVPKYDELSLFLMSLAFILLFVTSGWIGAVIAEGRKSAGIYAMVVLVALLFVLPVMHVFISRRKNKLEKIVMIFFAVTANAIAAFAGGRAAFAHTQGWLAVFPVVNILSSFMLLLGFRFDIINEDCISDENASGRDVLVGTSVLIVTFLVCRFVLGIHWAVTLSMCVVYATTLNGLLMKMLPEQPATMPEPAGRVPEGRRHSSTGAQPLSRRWNAGSPGHRLFRFISAPRNRWIPAIVVIILSVKAALILASLVLLVGLLFPWLLQFIYPPVFFQGAAFVGLVLGLFLAYRLWGESNLVSTGGPRNRA